MDIKNFFKNFFINNEDNYSFTLSAPTYDYEKENIKEPINKKNIFSSVSVNLDYIKEKYNLEKNSDIYIRKFTLTAKGKEFEAFLLYIDGMINSTMAHNFILNPLMLKNMSNINHSTISKSAITNNIVARKVRKIDLEDFIFKSLLPSNSIKKKNTFDEIIQDVNSGSCILFVDTLTTAFSIDIKGVPGRSVSTPNTEIVIKGSGEAFVEILRVNTAIIRRLVNNENLIIESLNIGNISRTNCAVAYIKNIANDSLVSEVLKRLNNLNIDYLVSTGELEQLIEDSNHSNVPQIISTERPDRTTSYLLEGRVVIFLNGNPYALVVPRNI